MSASNPTAICPPMNPPSTLIQTTTDLLTEAWNLTRDADLPTRRQVEGHIRQATHDLLIIADCLHYPIQATPVIRQIHYNAPKTLN